jgi:enoyl-CoA hydratase
MDLGSEWVSGRAAGGILRVRIDRVERRNAMTLDMYRAVKRAAVHADRTAAIRVIVITGTADVFASGGDMAGNAAPDSGLDTEWDPTDHFPFRHLELCRKPVIAAVNGICQAGGLNLLMYSDFSVVSDRAEFRAPELLRGIPDPWMLARLPGYVGVGTARRLIYTAARFDASEAAVMGLVGRVVPHEELEAAVDVEAAAVMACAPGAMATAKAAMVNALPEPDVAMFSRSMRSPEMAEGMAAFVEKRDPDWLP